MGRFLYSAVVAAAVLGGAVCRCSADDRPNILFAFADDWGRYASAYAKLKPGTPSDLISTPNFDRLAREGVLLTHAFVNAPSCTPCRSSLLSGQYFWQTGRGAILQGAVWDPVIPSFPLILKDRGYHIGFTYKVWSPGSPVDAPFGGQDFAYRCARGPFQSLRAIRQRAEGRRSRQANSLRRGSRQLSRFFERPAAGETVLLLVRANQHAPSVGRRLGQGLVGSRSRQTAAASCQAVCPTSRRCAKM